MFGEKNIALYKPHSLDQKGRLIIPCETGVEKSDTLCLKTDNEYCIQLYNFDEYSKYFDLMKKRQESMSSYDEYMEIQKQLDRVMMGVVDIGGCDSRGRIVIPKNILLLKKFLLEEEKKNIDVVLAGGGDHLNIYKSEEDYNRHIMSLKS